MLYFGININLKTKVKTHLKKPLPSGGKLEAYNKTFFKPQIDLFFCFLVKEKTHF